MKRIERDHEPACRKHPEHTGRCVPCRASSMCVLPDGHKPGCDHGHSKWNR